MIRERKFFGGWEETSPLPPSKGEMRRASIHEQCDVGTGESVSRTGDCGTSGTSGRLGRLRGLGRDRQFAKEEAM